MVLEAQPHPQAAVRAGHQFFLLFPLLVAGLEQNAHQMAAMAVLVVVAEGLVRIQGEVEPLERATTAAQGLARVVAVEGVALALSALVLQL